MKKLRTWAFGQIAIIWAATALILRLDYLKNLGLVMAVLLTAVVLSIVLIGWLMMSEDK